MLAANFLSKPLVGTQIQHTHTPFVAVRFLISTANGSWGAKHEERVRGVLMHASSMS